MSAAPGVSTLGELERLTFLETRATGGAGLLVDARLPDSFVQATVPGAVKVIYPTLAAKNRFRVCKRLVISQINS
jgi:hypothetical protein